MTAAKVIANIREPWDEMALRCAVGCDDFMVFTVEDIDFDEGDPDWWVEVSLVADMMPNSLWEMVKACWQLFRTGRWHRASADLSRANLAKLRDWCQYALDKTAD